MIDWTALIAAGVSAVQFGVGCWRDGFPFLHAAVLPEEAPDDEHAFNAAFAAIAVHRRLRASPETADPLERQALAAARALSDATDPHALRAVDLALKTRRYRELLARIVADEIAPDPQRRLSVLAASVVPPGFRELAARKRQASLGPQQAA